VKEETLERLTASQAGHASKKQARLIFERLVYIECRAVKVVL
jgi:hypothetical protein